MNIIKMKCALLSSSFSESLAKYACTFSELNSLKIYYDSTTKAFIQMLHKIKDNEITS